VKLVANWPERTWRKNMEKERKNMEKERRWRIA
jgi:hypothetical protein